MEPVGLRDEDDRGPERAAELADEPQLDAEPADGEPESNPVRGSDHSTQRRRSRSYRASQQSNVFDLCGKILKTAQLMGLVKFVRNDDAALFVFNEAVSLPGGITDPGC